MKKELTKAQRYVLTALHDEEAKINSKGKQPSYILPNGMSVLFRQSTFSTMLTLNLVKQTVDGYYVISPYGKKVFDNKFNLNTLKLTDMLGYVKPLPDGTFEAYLDGEKVGTIYTTRQAAKDIIDHNKRKRIKNGEV